MDDYKARCRAVRSAAPFVGTGVQPQGAAKHPQISKKGKATHSLPRAFASAGVGVGGLYLMCGVQDSLLVQAQRGLGYGISLRFVLQRPRQRISMRSQSSTR